jgi:tetratricopeptide (TPR) repeat protein/lysophospholipase L1-like esterase
MKKKSEIQQKLNNPNNILNEKPQLKSNKKIFFYSILIFLPLFTIALLELTLRLFSFGDDLSLFIPSSDPKYIFCNPNVAKRYFSKFEHTIPLADYFLKEKPANGYRIFVLGESTVQGFPYEPNIAFSRILWRRLQDVFPNRTIEVINLGLTAVNSYTLLDFIPELLQQKPDLVLIYTGHNEYYGALGVASMENGSIPNWLKKIHLKFVHLKTYQLLQTVIGSIYKLFTPLSYDDAKMTLMQKIVGKNIIPFNSELYNEGLVQFHDNMYELISKLKEKEIPVIISDQVSNIKDLPPFHSIYNVEYPPADSVYNNAKRLESKSLFDEAKTNFIKAKDLDAIRFRAPENINKIITELAATLNINCISINNIFEKYSTNGIIGDNLMTEHVHPNIDGYFLMAEGFFQEIKREKMIEKYWDTSKIKSWTYYRNNWGFTELDSSIADLRIKHLKAGWPFKPETTINNFIFEYKPKNTIDSLAFLTIKYDDVSIERLHKDLAAYFNSIGDLKRSSKEYLSLACTYPINSSYYYHAADFSYKAKDYDNAIRIFKESPFADTSNYAQYTLASIYFIQQKFKEALLCLDKLNNIKSDKKNTLLAEKLKYKIQKAAGLTTEAEKTLSQLKKIDPEINEEGDDRKSIVLLPEKIRPYLEKAEQLRKAGKLKEAINVLFEANNIYETPYINLLIGKILISQKDLKAVSYFEKAYEEIKDNPSLIYNLCLIYLIKEDIPKAKEKLKEFEKLEGKNHPRALQLSDFYNKVTAKKIKSL